MKKIPVYKFMAVCFFAVSPWLFISSGASQPLKQDKLSIETPQQAIDFTVEIAETPAQQEHGFMQREHIPDNHGMLFIWKNDFAVTMWMKDTPLSLDMLFIDKNGKIVYIASKTTPYSENIIDPKMPVRAVLEIPGGVSASKNIHVGDKVINRYFAHE